MARPAHVGITSGLAAWDGEVDDNFDLIFTTPVPIAQYANFAALPTASDYEDCLAILADTDLVVVSDGTSWNYIGTRSALVAALTGSPGGSATDTLAMSTVTARTYGGGGTPGNHATVPAPADTPASADALRDDLETNVLPVIRNSIATLATQMLEVTDAGGFQLDVRDNLQALTTKVNEILTALKAVGLMSTT